MHVRFSLCREMPILEEGSEQPLGTLFDVFIHPDLGVIEGFFVSIPRFFSADILFLSAADILHWGNRLYVRDSDVLGPLEERVRLHALWQEGRTMLRQKMMTEGGASLGTCRDVQFDTKSFRIEWLFPRTLLRWRTPVPASAIIEVRPDAVIVKDLTLTAEERKPVLQALDELTTPVTPVSSYTKRSDSLFFGRDKRE